MSESSEGPSDPGRRAFLGKLGLFLGGLALGGAAVKAIENGAAEKAIDALGNKVEKLVENNNIASKMGKEAGEQMRQRDAREQFQTQQIQDAKAESATIKQNLNQQNPQK